MKLTELLDQIQERSRTAGDHVARLCTKEDRWKMSVPVQDDDSDILLTQITDRDVPQLAKALREVKAVVARIRENYTDYNAADLIALTIADDIDHAIYDAMEDD